MEKIIYKYISQNKVLDEQGMNFLNYVYSISYPKPDKSFTEMCEDLKNEKEEAHGHGSWRKTYCDGKYQWPIDFFYVPHKVLDDVYDNYKEANDIENKWESYCDFLISLFKDGNGLREVYGPTEYSEKPIRHSEHVDALNTIIDDESAKKVISLIKDYRDTYRFDFHRMNMFSSYFLSTPSCKREKVVNAWKEAFGVDIEIPSDDTWEDEYGE